MTQRGADVESPEHPGQDPALEMHGQQSAADRADHPRPTEPPGGRDVGVALAQVRDPAHQRGGHDRRQRRALGHGLRHPKADRQDRHEDQPAADADRSAQQAGEESSDNRGNVTQGHGSTTCLMPTSTITIATPMRSWRSGMRFSARAPM